MSGAIDITGKKFGRLTVLRRQGRTAHRLVIWECRCDCGVIVGRIGRCLRKGAATSCGCGSIESLRKNRRSGNPKHGGYGTPEYIAWRNMRSRCLNPKNSGYRHYGGRGIRVCERWSESFAAFLEDMGVRPSPKHSLDRSDNDGNYEPSNCRWATRIQQARNRRAARRLELDGTVRCLSEWSAVTGLSREVIRKRLELGWSVRRALTTPVKGAVHA